MKRKMHYRKVRRSRLQRKQSSECFCRIVQFEGPETCKEASVLWEGVFTAILFCYCEYATYLNSRAKNTTGK